MTRISARTARELNDQDLRQRIQEARADLGKLRVDGAKGTLRKESGKIKPIKRDIARMMTVQNERRLGMWDEEGARE